MSRLSIYFCVKKTMMNTEETMAHDISCLDYQNTLGG